MIATPDKIKTAESLGARAYQAGLRCSPSVDSQLVLLLAHVPMVDPLAVFVLRAWRRGWHAASLAECIAS